jgi:hypothetical protein
MFSRTVNLTILTGLTAVCLVFGLCSTAFAQRFDGTLRGEVLDETGAVVAKATVTVTSEATGVSSTFTTTSVGAYTFGNLLPGTYVLTVEAPNFAKYENRGIKVDAGAIAEANVTLRPGGVTEVVEVKAGAEAVNTVTSAITSSFEKVNDIPIGAAGTPDITDLAIILPNVTAIQGTSAAAISIGGLRGRFNSYTIDGSDNNDLSTTSRVQNVIPDAVQELVVSTNVFSADIGHSSAAVFNVVTKTGTNSWHGGGWYYNQNRNYNAMTNIDKAAGLTEPPRFDQQRVGGQLGGPIRKEKFFVYGAFEWFNQGATSQSGGALGPTAAGLTTLKGLAANSAVASALNNFPVASAANGTITVNGTPIPVGPVVASAPVYDVIKNYIVNGDVNISSRNMLHTRYIQLDERQPDPNAPFPFSQFLGLNTLNVKTAIVNYVTTVNPRLVNDVRLLFQRKLLNIPVPDAFTTTANMTVDDLGIDVGPNPNAPQSGAQNTYQLQESMAYIIGRWNLKWGGEARKAVGYSVFAQRVRGDYEWDTLQNFVNDIPPTVLRSRNLGATNPIGRLDNNLTALYGFFQADVRVTPRLTLNLGLRYEWTGTPAGVYQNSLNSIANFLGCTSCGPNGSPLAPLLFGVPQSDKNNISPRLGFAWDPNGRGKWSIRGGFQIAYDVYPLNFYLNQQPSQRSFLIFLTGGAPVPGPAGTQDCNGFVITPPSWCAKNSGFLAGGGIPNSTPVITTQAGARSATSQQMLSEVLPKVIETSVGVQHEVWREGSIEVRYLYTRGLELPVQAQVNAVSPFDYGAQPLPVYFTAASIPANVPASAPTLAQFKALDTAAFKRPYSAVGFPAAITTFQPIGSSKYNALSVDYVQRSRWGVTGRADYTLSGTYDNATTDLNSSGIAQRRPQDINNLHGDWGPSVLGAHNRFAAGFTYDVPKLNAESGLAKGFLHGWQYGVTMVAQNGPPITAYSGLDSNGNGDSAGDRAIFNPGGTVFTGPASSRSTNQVCRDPGTGATSVANPCPGGATTVVGYVAVDPTQAYIQTPLGAASNVSKGGLSSNGLQVWNMSLAKKTFFGERLNMTFRAEAWNVFNHRNFSFVQVRSYAGFSNGIPAQTYSNASSSSFLVDPFLNGGSRNMQLGLRLDF